MTPNNSIMTGKRAKGEIRFLNTAAFLLLKISNNETQIRKKNKKWPKRVILWEFNEKGGGAYEAEKTRYLQYYNR